MSCVLKFPLQGVLKAHFVGVEETLKKVGLQRRHITLEIRLFKNILYFLKMIKYCFPDIVIVNQHIALDHKLSRGSHSLYAKGIRLVNVWPTD